MSKADSLEERTYVQNENNDNNSVTKNESEEDIPDYNDEEPDVKLTKTKFYLVILALLVSLIMSSLNISNVTTAIPKICGEFNSFEHYSWIITSYMLGNTAFQPMFGKFADIFGRRPVMLFSLVLFAASSLLCGASSSFGMIVVVRAFQGISSGGLMSMVNIIIADIVPLKTRGGVMGIIGAVFAVSSVVGPFVGGFLTDHISWRWVFYLNVPLGVISFIVISICVNIPAPPGSMIEKIKRIDFVGTFFIITSLVCLLLGLSLGGTSFEWSSPIIILLFVGFVVLFSIFILVEYKFAKEPITPLGLFKTRNVTFSCIVSLFLGIAFLGINNTLPLLYQNGRGITATNSGLRMIPTSITSSIATIGSGILIGKFGHIDIYMKLGSFLLIIACYLISTIGMNTKYIFELLMLALFGFSIGLNIQNCVLTTQQASPKQYLAIGTTIITFFRIIGGVFGVAIFNTVIQIIFPNKYQEKYPNATDVSTNNVNELQEGPYIYIESIQNTIRYVFVTSAVFAFVFSLFIKYIPFIKKSAPKEQSSEEMTKTINEVEECEIIDINIKKN